MLRYKTDAENLPELINSSAGLASSVAFFTPPLTPHPPLDHGITRDNWRVVHMRRSSLHSDRLVGRVQRAAPRTSLTVYTSGDPVYI
ncbi:hypothetical protein J6590_064402 [Homalodisca vitripennis]|nr:hypothetical protein J6590_064402 [Homalodisca vitripennis]